MRKTIMSMVVCVLLGMFLVQGVHAQETGPQGGELSFSLVLGKGMLVAPEFWYYEVNQVTDEYMWYDPETVITPPSISYYSGNDVTSMVGVEAKYFITPQIAVRFSGSGSINSSPSRDATPAIVPDDRSDMGPGTFIPGFKMTEGRTVGQFFATLGGDYYFSVGRERIHPYAGIQFNSAYGLVEIFDGFRGLASREVEDTDLPDPFYPTPPAKIGTKSSITGDVSSTRYRDEVITTWDTRRGEAWGVGGSVVGGVDYYLAEGFFFGFEIKVASYMYTGKRLFHQPGMEAQEAATFNTAFLAMPMVKLGFSF